MDKVVQLLVCSYSYVAPGKIRLRVFKRLVVKAAEKEANGSTKMNSLVAFSVIATESV